tara:strand:- start:125 stop:1000 length:876 start_codon:yes stop_codon:yes gene_type:complete
MIDVNIVISINMYKHDYFDRIWDEILLTMKNISFIVILNCCYKENVNYIKSNYNDKRIIINPVIISKSRARGGLGHGIVENMKYIINNDIHFKYFLILSNRTALIPEVKIKYNVLTKKEQEYPSGFKNLEELDDLIYNNNKLVQNLKKENFKRVCNLNNNFNKLYPTGPVWSDGPHPPLTHWPAWGRTTIFKYLDEKDSMIYATYHEGLFFPMESVFGIINFFNNNNNIFEEMVRDGPTPTNPSRARGFEEFALQSICVYKNLPFANMCLRRFGKSRCPPLTATERRKWRR